MPEHCDECAELADVYRGALTKAREALRALWSVADIDMPDRNEVAVAFDTLIEIDALLMGARESKPDDSG